MTKYVIGTISGMDTPLNPSTNGQRSMQAWTNRLTYEQIQQDRDQVLDVTEQDIRDLAPFVEAILGDGRICVVGSETALDGAGDVLTHIAPLFQ